MMGIIEKFGITKGYYRAETENMLTGQAKAVWVDSPEMIKIKDAAPEMLEALISSRRYIKALLNSMGENTDNFKLPPADNAIQKATGKSYLEIEKMLANAN